MGQLKAQRLEADSSRLRQRGQPGTQPWSSQRNKRTGSLPPAPHPWQSVGQNQSELSDTQGYHTKWALKGEPPQLCSQPKPPPGGSHCHWKGLTAPGHQAPFPPGSASWSLPRVFSLAAHLRGSHSGISCISHTSDPALGHSSAIAPTWS